MRLFLSILLLVTSLVPSLGQGMVLNPYRFSTGGTSSLNTGLVAYYQMDETSGNELEDSGAGHDLTDQNTVTTAAGIIGDARQFTSANTESLRALDSATWSRGDTDFSFSVWVYLDTEAGNMDVLGKYGSSGNFEYILRYNQSTDRFDWIVSGNGTSATTVTASNFGAPTTATWYHIVVWHDSVNNQIGIAVNAGTANTTAHSTGVSDEAINFGVGSRQNTPVAYWNGRIDELGLWSKVLTSGERTTLYGAGAAKFCCPFAP
jgi:hypothetical protein